MYNRYKNGKEAYYVLQDFIDPLDSLESAAENAASVVDDMEERLEECEQELKDVTEEAERLTTENEALRTDKTALELIKTLEAMHTASVALVGFTETHLTRLKEAYNVAEESPDGSTGAGSNGSDQDRGDEGNGSAPASGITRPQVP